MRLINSDALREKAHKLPNGYNWGWFHKCVDEMIDTAPTIDPVKHGEWKERIVDDEERMVYCSVCGDEYAEQGIDLASWVKDFFNYCPNCGAKMNDIGEGGLHDDKD